jgi:TolB protein
MSARFSRPLTVLILLAVILTACQPQGSPLRSQQPVEGQLEEEQSAEQRVVPEGPVAGNAGFLSTGLQIPSPTQIPPAPLQAPLWSVEEMPYSQSFDKVVTVLDAQGTIHAAWTGLEWGGEENYSSVYYAARQLDATWSQPLEIYRSEKSTTPLSIETLVLALDSSGKPTVVFAINAAVLITTLESAGWTKPGAIPPASCEQCSLYSFDFKIDPRYRSHLIWVQDGRVFYTSRPPGSEWSEPQPLSPSDDYADHPSLEVDPGGNLYAVWISQVGGGRTLSYASSDGQGWSQARTIAQPAYRIYSYSLAQDASGGLHLLLLDSSRSENRASFIILERPAGGEWASLDATPFSALTGTPFYLRTTSAGGLVMLWVDGEFLYVSTCLPGQTWSAPAAIPEASPFWNSLLVSPSDQVYVTWSSAGLWFAKASYPELAQVAVASSPAMPEGLPDFTVQLGPGERSSLAISGDSVVWQEKGDQDWDIFRANVQTGEVFPVSRATGDQLLPAVDGDLVVWEDHRAEPPRIYGRYLNHGGEFTMTAGSSPQWQPDLSGKRIVFRDWRKNGTCGWGGDPLFGTGLSCDWDIWGKDLDTGAEFPIDESTEISVSYPKISGDRVVWHWSGNEEQGIAEARFAPVAPQQKLFASSGYPPVSFDGNILVYAEWRDPLSAVFAYDLRSGAEVPVAVGSGKTDPAVSGSWVVWSDNRNGDYDIYAYDLSTGQEIPVCTAAGDQLTPAISGDLVAWVDKRNFQTEIYAARLPSAGEVQTAPIVPAPIPTPTPLPTETPAPTPSPAYPDVLLTPVLISPADEAVVEGLAPGFEFDFGPYPEGNSWRLAFEAEPAFSLTACEAEELHYRCYASENLSPGVQYRWQVKWQDADCEPENLSCWVASPVWSFSVTTDNSPIPSAPETTFPADGSEVNLNDETAFQWNPVAGAVLYEIYIKTGYPDNPEKSELYSTTAESFFKTGRRDWLLNYETTWAVRAFNGTAWGPWSDLATFTAEGDF